MMIPPGVPAEVLEFVGNKINSVPELETLLMMSDQPQRIWTAADIVSRIYVRDDRASGILELLQRRGLVTFEDQPPGYRFSPVDQDERALIALVARTYRSNIVALTTFIHERASASVMEFARAFDLKKER
jgi:hypothetical protein